MLTAIEKKFSAIQIDESWAFSGKTRKDTGYITHAYHRYPAKFIPQIASRLICEYSKEGDFIADPFGGCGTTLVEAKMLKRRSVGVDINPVAVLISKAKLNAIEPKELEKYFGVLKSKFALFYFQNKTTKPTHERIDYWFRKPEKEKLSFIFDEIKNLPDHKTQVFFDCAFSNILKNCSIWLQKSNKPTRDFAKKVADPFQVFNRQVGTMLRGNAQFYSSLNEEIASDIYYGDARNIPAQDNAVNLIVTSPPYVTSYEYADLHQLTAIWFNYTQELNEFRKNFIGSAQGSENKLALNSSLAEEIIKKLAQKNKKTANEVAKYFGEMNQVFMEMKRILKNGGKTCIVIGNTNLKGIEILNAEVFTEQLQNLDFKIVNIIKREIPSKNLPSVRNEKTGRFTKLNDIDKVFVYPTEYIIILEK